MRLLLLLGLLGCLGLASAVYPLPENEKQTVVSRTLELPLMPTIADSSEEDADPGSSSPQSASESEDSSEKWDPRAMYKLLKEKADALSKLVDEGSEKIKSLPPADADENSKASLTRKEFVMSFADNVSRTLEGSGEKAGGSTDEDEDETDEPEDWCILKTEAAIRLINGTHRHLQSLQNSENRMMKKLKVFVLKRLLFAGKNIIDSEWCARLFDYMKKKTEPVLQLIKDTYPKLLELPPTSSEGNSRTNLVMVFADAFKKIMDPEELKRIFYPSAGRGHHHHHGHHRWMGKKEGRNRWMGKGGGNKWKGKKEGGNKRMKKGGGNQWIGRNKWMRQ